MNVLSFDLAYQKPTTGYDLQKDKNFVVGTGEDKFEEFLDGLKEKHILLFEPGMNVYMLKAFNKGHKVLYTATMTTCMFRRRLGREKTDELDPKTIFLCYDSGEKFYEFSVTDEKRAILRLMSREYIDLRKEKQRKMNRVWAAKKNYKEENLPPGVFEKKIELQNGTIEAEKKAQNYHVHYMQKMLDKFALPEYERFLKPIVGSGAVTNTTLIGCLANADIRFQTKAKIKHYLRLVPDKYAGVFPNRKMVDLTGRRDLAALLYNWAQSVIYKKDEYYNLYLTKKKYLQKRSSEWEPYEVDRTAKLYIKQQFIIRFWRFLKELRNGE